MCVGTPKSDSVLFLFSSGFFQKGIAITSELEAGFCLSILLIEAFTPGFLFYELLFVGPCAVAKVWLESVR